MSEETLERQSSNRSLVQSVDRALQLLLAFEDSGPELSVQQLSHYLGLPKSTVHRLLTTLARRGFIEQVLATGNYRLGLRIHGLGAHTVVARTLASEAEPLLKRLLDLHGETVSVSVLDGTETVIVDKMESNLAMRVTSQIGKRSPIYCSASGKAILAFQKPESIDRLISQIALVPYTGRTITSRERLKSHLAEIRRCGYAVDDEEMQDDQICISAPVRDHEDSVRAAVTVSGPASRIRSKCVEAIATSVVEAARELSMKLGSSG